MADMAITLNPAQAEAILAICKVIKENPGDIETLSQTAQGLSASITTSSKNTCRAAEAARETSQANHAAAKAKEAAIKNAQYAEGQLTTATIVVKRASLAVDKAQKWLKQAENEMDSYYMLANEVPVAANTKARMAAKHAGLAMLELELELDVDLPRTGN